MAMNLTKRILAWVLILTLLAGNIPATAFAEDVTETAEVMELPEETAAPTQQQEEPSAAATEEATEPTQPETVPEETSAPVEETSAPAEEIRVLEGDVYISEEDYTSEELFEAYAAKLFYKSSVSMLGTAAGERLTGDEKILYDALVPIIKQIACGQRASASVSIGQAVTGYPVDAEAEFTATDLADIQLGLVIDALLADLPYECYWYEKTTGCVPGKVTVNNVMKQVILEFTVADNYSAGEYLADTEKTGAAAKSAAKAQTIVDGLASASDYEKLTGYRDAICDLVKYDSAAASGGYFSTDIDPWQLISVFDGDTTTNVVCEGYSKAFQYLCDLTAFSGDVVCYLVVGNMAYGSSGGAHMWNIVKIDGSCYLVDVTNSDDGTAGYDGSLFLVGAEGTVASGYTTGGATYTYDSDTTALWGTDESSILTLSSEKYTLPTGGADEDENLIASGTCGDNLTWKLDDEGTLTISGIGEMTDKPWRDPHSSEIKTVVIEEGVTSIVGDAFAGCSVMTSIELPNSLISIGEYAFDACCGLTSIEIPESVTSIGDWAIAYCDGLTSIEIPESVTSIGKYVFEYCGGLKSVTISNNVTSIGRCAFQYCSSLTSIEIPKSVTSIGREAFMGTNIKEIFFEGDAPVFETYENVQNTFCGVTATAYYPEGNSTWTSDVMQDYGGTITWVAYTPGESGEDENLIASGTCGDNLTWTLDDEFTLTISGTGEMEDFGFVTGPSFENPFVLVTPWADYESFIKKVVIADGVTSIGNYAFTECSGLTSVEIPGSLSDLGDSVFNGCRKLEGIWVDAANNTYCSDEFGVLYTKNMDALLKTPATYSGAYEIPNTVITIDDRAFYFCENLRSVKIPNSVTSIEEAAFAECSSLTSIEIPNTISKLSDSVFDGCISLTNVKIPDSVTSIGAGAFLDCSGLTSITIPNGVTSIGNQAFEGCAGLTGVDILDSVTNIGEWAFHLCTGLTSIDIPDSVTSIGERAFEGCTNLTSVTIGDGVTSIGDYAFIGCNLTNVTLGSSVSSIGETAFWGASGLNNIVFPDSLTSIGAYAFEECTGLTSITFPGSITGIGEYAFCNCKNVTEMTFEGSAPEIDATAFQNVCAKVYYPADDSTWTEDRLVDYDGALTWIPVCKTHVTAVLEAVTPTCTETGLSEGSYCVNCKTILVAQQTIPALGHTEVIDEGVAATCTSSGMTEGKHCSVCSEVLTAQKYTNPLGHSMSDWTIITEVGCGTDGLKSRECQREGCDYVEEQVIACAGHQMVDGECTNCGYVQILDSGACGENLTYTLNGKYTLTISGTGAMTNYQSYAPWFNLNERIHDIVLEEGVTTIGDNAFRTSVNLADVNIPDSVTSIGAYAFYNCTSLTNIEIPDSVTSIGAEAFHFCTGLASITLPTGITAIPDYAFNRCSSLTSITFPEKLTRIDAFSFYECTSLEKITFTGDAPVIGTSAFYNVTATAYYPAGNSTWTSDVMQDYGDGTITWIAYGESENVEDENLIASGTCGENLTWKLDKDGTLTISGTGAMSDYLEDTIPWYDYREQIKHIVIKEGVTGIGNHAFDHCTALQSIKIPGSVTSMGFAVFNGSESLNELYITDLAAWLNMSDPYGARPLMYRTDGKLYLNGELVTDLALPEGITGIREYAFHNCSNLKRVTIPDTVTDIGIAAFAGCSGLIEINIPDAVTVIREGIFRDCSSLTSITIPNGVTSIEWLAFHGCSSLKSISIPNGITDIAAQVFFGCSSLTSVRIPDSVTSIGSGAFGRCSDLTSIDIPDGVTSIGDEAFWDCGKLTAIQLPAGLTHLGASAFAGCTRLKTINIPEGITGIGFRMFSGCKNLTEIAIPGGVTAIEEEAFYRCERLSGITIPENVTAIGKNAFSGCSALKKITFMGGAPDIDANAFGNQNGDASAKATVYYHMGNPTWTADKLQNYGGKLTWVAKCLAHSEVVLEALAPNCTESGLTEGSYCEICGEIIVAQQDIPALGHAYEAAVTQPGCTEIGYTTYTCHCGDEYTDYYVSALGHDLSRWEITVEATCTEDGEKQYFCSRCDHTETERIPALGHSEVVVPGVAPTCTETGMTEGKHCDRCKEIFVQQEVLPAIGHDFKLVGNRLDCSACGLPVYLCFEQEHMLVECETSDEPEAFTIPVQYSHEELADSVCWKVEGTDQAVEVDDQGRITVVGEGTNYIVATAAYEGYTLSTRCRIDVIDLDGITGIRLSAKTLTTELYSTAYTSFDALLETSERYVGAAIEDVRFTDEAMAELFELEVLNGCTVQIIPTEKALENGKSLKSSYASTVTVTVQGQEYVSEKLTLTVKKSTPKLKATVAAFNSFYSGQSHKIVITGGTVTSVYENEAKNTAKTTAIPYWLSLEDGALTLNEDAPLKSVSGSAYIMVETEEWRIPAALTLSVKNTYKAPGLKLSATTVTMSGLTEESDGISMKLLCSNKKDTLESLNVYDITAPEGYSIENFNVTDGSFTLKAAEGFKAGKIALQVCFLDTDVALKLNLTVKTAKVALKLASSTITLNQAVSDSGEIKVTATPADFRLEDPTIRLTGTETVNKKKVTVDKTESGELDISFENGIIRIKTTDQTPEKATYKLYISAGGSKEAAATINVISGVPTVTYKATGSMDLSFPNQRATITATFKNYSGKIVSYDYTVAEMKGKTTVGDATDQFEMEQEGRTFKIRCTDDSINIANSYAVSLKLMLEDGSELEKSISLKVKRTAAKLKLSAAKLSLNKLIGDTGSITVSCITKGYDFIEPIWTLTDSKNKPAEGELTINYKNGQLTVSTNDATVYGKSYKIVLKADEYGTASTLTVSIPTQAKSKPTVTIKAAGKIDIIRTNTAVTVTPTYKNCITTTGAEETITITNSKKEDVTSLFCITPNDKGGYTVTKAEGAAVPAGTYKVKLAARFGELEIASKEVSMTVAMGTAKLTVKTSDTTMFAKDVHDRAMVYFEATDLTLNEVSEITFKNASQAKLFEIIDYGGGMFAIGFKDGNVDKSLLATGKATSKTITVSLNVFIDGNETTKANSTASVKLTIVK